MGGAFAGDKYGDAVFENPGFGAHWIGLRLVGRGANRSAIGALVEVEASGPSGTSTRHRIVGSGGSFGANPLEQYVGLADAERVEAVTITWPSSGARQTFADLAIDRRYLITEGEEAASPWPRP